MATLTKDEITKKFVQACQAGDLLTVKNLYMQSSDKQGFKLKFLTKEPVFDAHNDQELALRSANVHGHHNVVKFLLEDQDFIKNLEYKSVLTKLFNNSVSNGFLTKNKSFEITTLVVPLIKELEVFYDKQILLGFSKVCASGDIPTLEYLVENLNVYSILPMMTSQKPYALKEHGFIEACGEGNLDAVKFFLTSPKLREKVDFEQIITPVLISDMSILEYLVFDFNMPRDSALAKHIISDNLDSVLEKRDLFNSLNSSIKSNNPEQKSRLKL